MRIVGRHTLTHAVSSAVFTWLSREAPTRKSTHKVVPGLGGGGGAERSTSVSLLSNPDILSSAIGLFDEVSDPTCRFLGHYRRSVCVRTYVGACAKGRQMNAIDAGTPGLRYGKSNAFKGGRQPQQGVDTRLQRRCQQPEVLESCVAS